jgi:DNA-binding MltR family transcriptional regulator
MILADTSGKAIVTKEFADENYGIKTTVPIIAPLPTDSGKIGEIRVMADYIYAYVALNTWVRFKNDMW